MASFDSSGSRLIQTLLGLFGESFERGPWVMLVEQAAGYIEPPHSLVVSMFRRLRCACCFFGRYEARAVHSGAGAVPGDVPFLGWGLPGAAR